MIGDEYGSTISLPLFTAMAMVMVVRGGGGGGGRRTRAKKMEGSNLIICEMFPAKTRANLI